MGHTDDGKLAQKMVLPVVPSVAAEAYEEFQLSVMAVATGWRLLAYGFDDEGPVQMNEEDAEVHVEVGTIVEGTLEDSKVPSSAVVSVGNEVEWVETEDLLQEEQQLRFVSHFGFDAASLQEVGSEMQELGPATQLDLAMIVLAGCLAVEVAVLIAEIVVMQVAECQESLEGA